MKMIPVLLFFLLRFARSFVSTGIEPVASNFNAMLNVIEQTEAQGRLALDLTGSSYPNSFLSETLISYGQLLACLNTSGNTSMVKAGLSLLDKDEDLSILTMAIILERNDFVKLAIFEFPEWMHKPSKSGKNAIHIMAMFGSPEINFWIWDIVEAGFQEREKDYYVDLKGTMKTKYRVASNHIFFIDPIRVMNKCQMESIRNNSSNYGWFQYAYLLAWTQVDSDYKTPLTYLIQNGSDHMLNVMIDASPAALLLIHQDGKSGFQILAERQKFEILWKLFRRFPGLATLSFTLHGTILNFIASQSKISPAAEPFIRFFWQRFPVSFADYRSLNGFSPLDTIPTEIRQKFEPKDFICLDEILYSLHQFKRSNWTSKTAFRFNVEEFERVANEKLLAVCPNELFDNDGNVITVLNDNLGPCERCIGVEEARRLGLLGGKIFTLPDATDAHARMLHSFVRMGRTDLVIDLLSRFDFVDGYRHVLGDCYLRASLSGNMNLFQALVASNRNNFVNYVLQQSAPVEYQELQNVQKSVFANLNTNFSLITFLILNQNDVAIDILLGRYPELLHHLDEERKTPIFNFQHNSYKRVFHSIFKTNMLKTHPSRDYLDSNQMPFISYILIKNRWDQLKYLLDNGIYSLVSILNQGHSVLQMAIRYSNEEMIRNIVERYCKNETSDNAEDVSFDIGDHVTSSGKNILHLSFLNPNMNIKLFRYLYYLEPKMAMGRDANFWTPSDFASIILKRDSLYGLSKSFKECLKFLTARVTSLMSKSTTTVIKEEEDPNPGISLSEQDLLALTETPSAPSPVTKKSKKKKRNIKSQVKKEKTPSINGFVRVENVIGSEIKNLQTGIAHYTEDEILEAKSQKFPKEPVASVMKPLITLNQVISEKSQSHYLESKKDGKQDRASKTVTEKSDFVETDLKVSSSKSEKSQCLVSQKTFSFDLQIPEFVPWNEQVNQIIERYLKLEISNATEAYNLIQDIFVDSSIAEPEILLTATRRCIDNAVDPLHTAIEELGYYDLMDSYFENRVNLLATILAEFLLKDAMLIGPLEKYLSEIHLDPMTDIIESQTIGVLWSKLAKLVQGWNADINFD